jgi:hypothetical protein
VNRKPGHRQRATHRFGCDGVKAAIQHRALMQMATVVSDRQWSGQFDLLQ